LLDRDHRIQVVGVVSTSVHLLTHELFGSGVGDGADGHVRRGNAADVIHRSAYTKVGEENSLFVGV
jgi:hypothetical protein